MSIEKITKRYQDLGSATLHVSGAAKIWINHYLNDVAFLLEELRPKIQTDYSLPDDKFAGIP